MIDVPWFEDDVTFHDKYKGALQVETEEDAERYLEGCIEHHLRVDPESSEEEAREKVLSSLGYYAGYCGMEAREKVERLFGAIHPVLRERP